MQVRLLLEPPEYRKLLSLEFSLSTGPSLAIDFRPLRLSVLTYTAAVPDSIKSLAILKNLYIIIEAKKTVGGGPAKRNLRLYPRT
jgi:hypothetical protein